MGDNVKKVRNIRENPRVAFGIPYPHHFIRPAPDFCIQFQGTAEILPLEDPGAARAFRQNPMLRRILDQQAPRADGDIFLKIIPEVKIFGFGLGMNIFKLLKNIERGRFVTMVPADRR